MLDFLSKQQKESIRLFLNSIGCRTRDWARVVMYEECTKLINKLEPHNMDALEISSGFEWKNLGFKSFTEANFPEFDICAQTLEIKFDLIIADQVWEHLLWPYKATQNVLSMLKPGGYFLITTPFLIKVHDMPNDCSRWTEVGIKYFLAECGFPIEEILTGSWGNRKAVIGNLKRFPKGFYRSLKNESEYPLTVWALAKKAPMFEDISVASCL
jgi:SAM-dependent methyltransferase